MGRVSTGGLQDGMALAADVISFSKQLLLPAGTVLTKKHIEKLKAWGVREADIQGHSDPTLEELEVRIESAPELAAASAELDHRFAAVRDDPLMQEILAIVKKRLLARST